MSNPNDSSTGVHQTKEQERAKAAWECIEHHSGKLEDYETVVSAAPAMIQNNGLGQTVAFYSAKNGQSYVDDLAYWLLIMYKGEQKERSNNLRLELIETLNNCSSEEYRFYTEEAMAFTGWLKRFATAKAKS